MRGRKKLDIVIILAFAATLAMVMQSVAAGFFDGWGKKPGYGGGYFEPQYGR